LFRGLAEKSSAARRARSRRRPRCGPRGRPRQAPSVRPRWAWLFRKALGAVPNAAANRASQCSNSLMVIPADEVSPRRITES
jgi:hypothetical protein